MDGEKEGFLLYSCCSVLEHPVAYVNQLKMPVVSEDFINNREIYWRGKSTSVD
jgi:hypothetical protein